MGRQVGLCILILSQFLRFAGSELVPRRKNRYALIPPERIQAPNKTFGLMGHFFGGSDDECQTVRRDEFPTRPGRANNLMSF